MGRYANARVWSCQRVTLGSQDHRQVQYELECVVFDADGDSPITVKGNRPTFGLPKSLFTSALLLPREDTLGFLTLDSL